MRQPSKKDAKPSFSQPEACVASETNWCAASWKSVLVMFSKPASPTKVSTDPP